MKHPRRIFITNSKKVIILMFLLIFYKPLHAQWEQTKGPEWGIITSTLIDNNTILIGTNGGVYTSVNAGDSWEKANIGYDYLTINALVKYGSSIMAGSSGQGVLVSNDGGITWNSSNNGLSNLTVNSIDVFGFSIFVGTNQGPFMSIDNGFTWTAINNGISNIPTYSVLSFNAKLYIGTSSGVYISTNNGSSWINSTSGMGSDIVHKLISSGSNILAACVTAIYNSSNNGSTWTAVNTSSEPFYTFCKNGSNLYVGGLEGISFSTDDGNTWSSAKYLYAVKSIAFNGSTMYCGTSRGIFKSTDNGNNFTAINKNIYCSYMSTIYAKTGLLLTGEGLGYTYSSTSYGWDWQNAGSVNFFNIFGTNLYTFSSKGNRLFAGTGNGVYASDDNGVNWYSKNTGMIEYPGPEYANIRSIVVSGNTIYVATSSSGLYTGNGVYVSNDDGATWTSSNLGGLDSKDVYSLAANGSTILAGTYKNAVYVSNDNGFSWTQKNSGIGSTFFGGYYTVNSLTVSGGNFLAGTTSGLYLSTNNGDNWSKVSGDLAGGNINSLLTVVDTVYAVSELGVYKSLDKGVTWTSMNNGLINTSVTSLATDGAFLYASTSGSAVWRYKFIDGVGIEKNNLLAGHNITIYPNPVNSESPILNINTTGNEKKTIELWNNLGQQLSYKTIITSNEHVSMDISDLPSGLYLLKVESNKGSSVQKVIKQ